MSERAETLLIYGATDTGKTVQMGRAAEWEFGRTGRLSRLISADSGWDPIRHLVRSPENPGGIIEAWNIQSLRDPWVVLITLSEGQWPQVIQVQDAGWKLKMTRPVVKDGWITLPTGEQIGQYLIEGLSTLGSTGLQDHQASARKLSQDVVAPFHSQVSEVSPDGKESIRDVMLSAAAPSHYGQVQRFLLDDLVPRFGKLGVSRVIWTAHEAKGRDEITGIEGSALGPATVGKAAVDRTTLKFGHSFHMTVETSFTKNGKGADQVNREFRAWFVSHPDSYLTRMSWPAKVSLSTQSSKALLAKFPGGYIPMGDQGIAQFLDFLYASNPMATPGPKESK